LDPLAAALVQVEEDRSDLVVVAIPVYVGAITKCGQEHSIHLPPSDVLCHQLVVAVCLLLPQHPSSWHCVVSPVKQQGLFASACVNVHHLKGLLLVLLNCI
jgi:hypothetical protein